MRRTLRSLVISNTQAETLTNTAKVIANDYPADVQITGTKIIPYLSVSLSDTPDPVTMGGTLHDTVEVDLNQFAPTDATGIELVMQLPSGVELESMTTDYGSCDNSNLPTLTCMITDISVASAEGISHSTVNLNVTLTDMGLLLLTHEAKVTANEYPAHTDRERTKIFIGDVKVDMIFVIDDTGSMQEEIDAVVVAIKKFIAEIDPNIAPSIALVTFKNDVKVRAATADPTILLQAVENIKVSGDITKLKLFLVPNVFVGNAYRDAPASHLIKKWKFHRFHRWLFTFNPYRGWGKVKIFLTTLILKNWPLYIRK